MPKEKIKSVFEWAAPIELTVKDAQELGLVKGVLMREGKVKSGENMTRDNILSGGGALRGSAVTGHAIVDIDHYKDELPEKYVKKYGKEINDPYPVGHVVDAQVVEADDGKVEIQALMAIGNKKVYELIKDNKIKGNSVVDFYRKLTCDDDCNYEGSAFLLNTLVLDEVPNADGTWVSPIDDDDIGSIIQNVKKETHANRGIMKILNEKLKKIHAAADDHDHVLQDYMTDGMWNDGIDSAKQFLIDVKEFDDESAAILAKYLIENPETLNQYQLEHLSSADILAWWNHAKIENIHEAIQTLLNNQHTLLMSNPAIKQNIIKYSKAIKEAKK